MTFDENSDECKYWVEYAHLALEYDRTISPDAKEKEPTNMLEYVAHKFGACPKAMGEMTMFL